MPIGNENIRPAVVVIVEKLRPKPQIRTAHPSDPRRSCLVGKFAIVIVVIKIVGIVGKIRLHNVRPPVAIVIRRIDAHPRLLVTVRTILGAHLGKSALAVVVIQQARRRIIRHIEIETTVLVVIEPHYTQPVIALGINAKFFGDIGESAIPVIVIKTVAPALQSARPAIHRNAAILAKRPVAKLRQVVDIEVDIVRNIQIEVAIVVIVAKRRARSPAIGVLQPRLRRYVGKRSIVIIVVKPRRMALAGAVILQRRSIDQ